MQCRSLITGLVLVATLSAGCARSRIGFTPETPRPIDPSAKPEILAPAAPLKGRQAQDFITAASPADGVVALDSAVIRNVAAQVSPAVVSIFTKTKMPWRFKLLPIPTSGLRFSVDGEALGSGFFIHEDGWILTNAHVLENATAVTVRTEDGRDFAVELAARDQVYDLALLKVVAPDRKFAVIPMADSADALIGDWVIAVGNPLGLGHTVTHGIVSQTGRELNPELKSGERQIRFLQTDTPINPGSSGGPLVTLSGAFIGVNTAVLVNSQGISFCVPTQQVREFIDAVLQGGP